MKFRIPSKPQTPRRPDLYQDFVLNLHNNLTTIFDIRTILRELNQFDNWAFILPRRLIGSIGEPYDLQEMDYDEILSEPNAAQAVLIYQQWDAVMVKKIREPLQ